VTLELGGKGPQILLEDADLAVAIPIALAQSGIGREFGTFGLDAFLEPRAVLS
jgi:acyl-CoA reductase-like NAD-dependent aldehyde dehydrogenase